ncbi:MAG: rhodanese-like domain-containing protein, partial [Thermoleophilia bacterium]|nr:rhodanese-like domain-containing protein [Thermoleophilia bacterium]
MAILVLTGYSCGDTDEGPPATETVREETGPSLSPDQVLKNRAHEVLAAVTDLDTAYPGNLITSARLDEMLENPGDAGNLYLLDTRPRDEWESQGHIEGATWIQMQEIADPGNLENLPRDRLIVCISSTGHTAVQVASVLRWLGYDAVALEFGMAGWTGVPARQVILDDVEGGLAGVYPAAMQPPMPAATGAAAAANGFRRPSDAELDILVETARTFLHDNLFEKEYPFNHIFAD